MNLGLGAGGAVSFHAEPAQRDPWHAHPLQHGRTGYQKEEVALLLRRGLIDTAFSKLIAFKHIIRIIPTIIGRLSCVRLGTLFNPNRLNKETEAPKTEAKWPINSTPSYTPDRSDGLRHKKTSTRRFFIYNSHSDGYYYF